MDIEGITNRVAASMIGRFRIPLVPLARKAKVEAALSLLDAGYQNRQIWNVDYNEAKDILSHALDAHAETIRGPFLSYWQEQREKQWPAAWTSEVDAVYYAFPSGLYQLGSFAKSLKRYKGFLAAEMKEFVDDWAPIAQAFKDLKPFIQKGRKVDPNAVPKDRYVAPRTTTGGQRLVEEALKKVVDTQAGKLVKNIAESYMRDVERFLAERTEIQTPYDFYKKEPERRDVTARLVEETSGHMMAHLPKTYVLKGDAKQRAEKLAEAVVKDIVDRYLYKNTNKIGSIVERKGNLDGIKVSYGSLAGWGFAGDLVCSFTDGTQFTVRNKVVYKYSYSGKPFVQFPTTFHNVVWPDGKRSAMLSEEQMNEEWAKA